MRAHLPEYAIEAWALGTFMLSAASVGVLLEAPGSPLHGLLPDPDLRRGLAGLAMGVTAVALFLSPWGKRSGSHLNPAVTLGYWLLGRVRGADALGYALAQFAGGLLGVLLARALYGAAFTEPPVDHVLTLPGPAGVAVAFAAETLLSFTMFTTVLALSAQPRLARWTPWVAGGLVAAFIAFEAPLSGMSINPARSFASAAPAGHWTHLWIYFLAPPLGMVTAAVLFRRRGPAAGCAKLLHTADVRCIHCGHEPGTTHAAARPALETTP